MKRMALLLIVYAAPLPVRAQETAAPPPPTPVTRPAQWAEPLTVEGVPNLHRITPLLYRSEQPSALGMRNLEILGVRTIINLRAFSNDKDEVRGTQLRTERTRILTWDIDDHHVIEVMRMLRHSENAPFLSHCKHGADRTGLMTAMYRVLEQNWTADEALRELTDGGYGYHPVWSNILRYVRSADVSALRAAIERSSASPTGSTSTVTDN